MCLDCGNVFSIIHFKSDLHKYGHVKNLWCYQCQKVAKHFEIIDIGKFLFHARYNTSEIKFINADDLESKAKKLVLQKENMYEK